MSRGTSAWGRAAGRRRFLGGAAAGIAGVWLAACGSSSNNKESSGSAPATSGTTAASGTKTAPTVDTSVKQQAGGKLLWAANADLNPQSLPYSSSVWLFPIQYGVYDYLTKYKGFTLESTPRMAEKWEQPSPTQVTLHLRDGLKWHTGEAVTAQDIVFNFQKIAESRSGVLALAKRVKAAAPDPKTVTVSFEEPMPGVFDLFNYMEVAHPPTFGDDLTSGRKVVGSGPFKFKEWTPGQHLVLEKNKEWWRPDRPFLDEIEYRIYPQTSIATAMEAGEIDYTGFLEIPEAVRLSKTKNLKLIPGSDGYTFLYFASNVEHPALKDQRVRQAINYAIDRKRIADEVMGGIAPMMVLPFPSYSPAYNKSIADTVTYDPKKSKDLLTAAGYTSSAPELPLSFSASLTATEGIMTVIQNDLKKLGMNTKLDKKESSVYIDQYIKKSLPGGMSFLLGYAGMYPSTFLLGPFAPPNFMHYGDDAFSAQLQDWFKKANNKDTLKPTMDEFNKFLLDQAIICPVVSNTTPHMINTRVQGFNLNVVDDIMLEEVSISKS
jgi:peptide/nickel transport system substrate-binding protein